jgi:hypothetical protein
MEGSIMAKMSDLLKFNQSELNGIKYCSARLTSVATLNQAIVPFDDMFENIGGFVLNSDGSITVPEDGTYMIFARVNKNNDENDTGSFDIRINGNNYGTRTYMGSGAEIYYLTPGVNFQIVSLNKNDKIDYYQDINQDFTVYGDSGESSMCQITLIKIGD